MAEPQKILLSLIIVSLISLIIFYNVAQATIRASPSKIIEVFNFNFYF